MAKKSRTPKASLQRTSLLKRFFAVVGALTFLFLALLGAALGYGSYLSNALAPTGKVYAYESVLSIVTTWSEDELVKRSSPELRAATTKGELDQFFVSSRKLGQFQSYDGPQENFKEGVRVSFNFKKGLIITSSYRVTATFQNGIAVITIGLIRHNNNWQIASFHTDQRPFPFDVR